MVLREEELSACTSGPLRRCRLGAWIPGRGRKVGYTQLRGLNAWIPEGFGGQRTGVKEKGAGDPDSQV